MGRAGRLGAKFASLTRENVEATKIETLTTKEFIRSEERTFANEKAFAFRHVLVRDSAYEATLKRTRAALHERFAAWLEGAAGQRIGEYEEIVGYHLEQAYRYRCELGAINETARGLGVRAANFLAAGGRRALGLGNAPAATNLLARAEQLIRHEPRLRAKLLVDLGSALDLCGDYPGALARLDQASALAREIGEVRLEGLAFVERVNVEIASDTLALDAVEDEVFAWIDVFDRLEGHEGLARAKALLANFYWGQFQWVAAQAAMEAARSHERGTTRDQKSFAFAGTPAVWQLLLRVSSGQVRNPPHLRSYRSPAPVTIATCRSGSSGKETMHPTNSPLVAASMALAFGRSIVNSSVPPRVSVLMSPIAGEPNAGPGCHVASLATFVENRLATHRWRDRSDGPESRDPLRAGPDRPEDAPEPLLSGPSLLGLRHGQTVDAGCASGDEGGGGLGGRLH